MTRRTFTIGTIAVASSLALSAPVFAQVASAQTYVPSDATWQQVYDAAAQHQAYLLGNGTYNGSIAVNSVPSYETLLQLINISSGQLQHELDSNKTVLQIAREYGLRSNSYDVASLRFEALARNFGMNVDDLTTELQSGKTVLQIAKERGLGPSLYYNSDDTVNIDMLAPALGISTDQLRTDLQNGETVDQIAYDLGLDSSAFNRYTPMYNYGS